MKLSIVALSLLATTSSTFANGSDDCATPTPIGGTGSFAFDTTGATSSATSAHPGCVTISQDIWWVWTAPATGIATFSTCGQLGGSDSAIAAYPVGTCPGTIPPSACDDDACGLESIATFFVSAGSQYMLQIGHSGAGGGALVGTFTLDVQGPPANDDCANAIDLNAIGQPGGAQYDNSQATASVQGQSNPCGSIGGDLWYVWHAPENGTATFETCFQSSLDTSIAVYDGATCPSGSALACDDNGCAPQSTLTFPIVGGNAYMLQIGTGPGASGGPASFTISVQGDGTNGTSYCSGNGSGTACPCGNSGAAGHGCANSVDASGARLTAGGSASVTNDQLVLTCVSMPATASALYFQGTTQTNGGNGTVFGDGLRCVSGSIARLGTRTSSGGSSQYGAPLGDTPISVKGAIPAAGGTRFYQTWYRNAASFCTASTFNLSNGLRIVWIP